MSDGGKEVEMKDMSAKVERRLTVRIPGTLFYLLMSYCREHGMRPSAVIRAALVAFLGAE